jgi:ribosomal protein L11 methyltransferase
MRTWAALDVRRPPAQTAEVDPAQPDLLDLFQAALTDHDIAAVDETNADSWRVFFNDAEARDRALTALQPQFPALRLAAVDVDDQDWAAKSQADLHAITVGRIIVAPPWDAPLVITIQPSMGFGTGHHATTRLCLAALQAIDVSQRTVLDVGTGSGVLAIAASRLGAPEVSGIDDDADAIQAAWENLALNPGASVTLLVGDLRTTVVSPADVVFANLTGGLLLATADRLRALTEPGGRLILSGFLTHEEADVTAAFGYPVEHRSEEEGWVCVTLRSPQSPG